MVVAAAAISNALRRKRHGTGAEEETDSSHHREETRFQWIATAMKQKQVREAYRNSYVQWSIAGLIMGNFITNIVEKEIDPWNLHYAAEWRVIEAVWNVIFILEIVWNIYGSFFLSTLKNHFICSGWNLFDLLVVSVSIPSLIGIPLGAFAQLRMLRAFRVFRLFKRIKSLNKIIVSLGRAVPGIINAAVVQTLVMCIYAIVGVEMFGTFGADGTYTNMYNESVPLITTRGITYGEEYYGTFFRSLYTLFQVLTGESWSEAVARPIIFADGQVLASIYFVSYVIICGIVLVNVAVAVLLEKMVEPPELPSIDGIVLSEMPEHVQALLKPLDLDNSGNITSAEMEIAAKALKRSKEGLSEEGGTSGEALDRLVTATKEGVSTSIHTELEQTNLDIKDLRQESRLREERLIEALDAAAQRETALQDSLKALSASMATLTSHATRVRRNGAPRESRASGLVRHEDIAQDGDRSATKQAPERMQQRL